VSIAELVSEIFAVLGVSAKTVREPARKFDVPAIVLDTTRAKEAFNWEPRITLDRGLREVVEWLQVLSASSATIKAV
jgi:nucleoside-diphosphate-sugar epimerase